MQELKQGFGLGLFMSALIFLVQLLTGNVSWWAVMIPLAVCFGAPLLFFGVMLVIGLWVHR